MSAVASAYVHVHAKHYKHDEDGRTAPGVRSHGSIPLCHSGNVVTRIGLHTHTKHRYENNNNIMELPDIHRDSFCI